MSLFNLSRRAEDVSFSTFTAQDPTTDLLLGKLLGLVSYFDNVDYSEASKLEDLFYWASTHDSLSFVLLFFIPILTVISH